MSIGTGIGRTHLTFKEKVLAPSTPTATYNRLFFKADGLHYINSVGTDVAIAGTTNMTTSTNPGVSAATTTAIVDVYAGVVILQNDGTPAAQTIGAPTTTTAGKIFTVVNNDTSVESVVVNGFTITPGEAQSFIWDGSAWGPTDIGITAIPVTIAQGGTGQVTAAAAMNALGVPSATAESNFIASGATPFAWVKKTLAEVKTILGLGTAAYTAATEYVTHALATAANDMLFASGVGAYVKKTLAEGRTLLGLDGATTTIAVGGGVDTAPVWTTATGTGAPVRATNPTLAGAIMSAAFETAYATVASHATTSAIWAAAGNVINFTGTETLTDLPAAPQAGAQRTLICAGAVVFTHAGSLTVQGAATYTAAAGDVILVTATTTTAFKVNILNQASKPAILLAGTAGKTITCTQDTSLDEAVAMSAKAPKASPVFTGDVTLAGKVVNTTLPAFLAFNSATDADVTGDGTAYTVLIDSEIFDQGANFSNGTFTAPVTGKYLLVGGVRLTGLAAGHTIAFYLKTSNRDYMVIEAIFQAANEQYNFNRLVDMDAADTVYIYLTVSGGAKTVDVHGHASEITTCFGGHLVC